MSWAMKKKKQLKNSLDITELTLCLPSSTNFIALQLCGEPSFYVALCFNVTVVHSLKLGRNHVMVWAQSSQRVKHNCLPPEILSLP